MTQYFFEKPGHAALYQKYRLPSPNEINDLILNYLQTKKGKPFTLAVDVGCGSGQSTRGLTSYFEEVVGIDISEAQIEEAKKMERSDNVSYRQGLAEELGFQDGSVDLVTVGAAAQWFDLEKFMKEIDRVLKPKGCLALYCYTVPCILNFDDCSETLTQIIQDLFTELKPYETIATKRVWNEYRDLFDAIPFPDKARAKDIFITFKKPVSWFIGYLNSSVLFQTYLREKLEDAKAFMENTEQRLLKAMGVSSEAIVEFRTKYYCLLASKPE
ncbi:putative methyltransferase DDB_G0268948 [Chiloscyllium plagiosum]|uniref:putative methyltransferase DDB_G0268948 n=1 Tax=Chiloscyllium plagiosum TaxID=36176 RepID=UPI001CB7F4A7|nr:putative methyltransferase DDB_G0268948 [Chiloscyllium plagiosum]XP_043549189.1 putative methyltransferase DDB_G0268948 [Chiloscyllium plagiosum]